MSKDRPTIIVVGETHLDGLSDCVIQEMTKQVSENGKKYLVGIEYHEADFKENGIFKDGIGSQNRQWNSSKAEERELKKMLEIAETKKMPENVASEKYFYMENEALVNQHKSCKDDEERLKILAQRDQFMAQSIKDKIAKEDVDFVFVSCGANHVSGIKKELGSEYSNVNGVVPYRFEKAQDFFNDEDVVKEIAKIGLSGVFSPKEMDKMLSKIGGVMEDAPDMVFTNKQSQYYIGDAIPSSAYPSVESMSKQDKLQYKKYEGDIRYFGANHESLEKEASFVLEEAGHIKTENLNKMKNILAAGELKEVMDLLSSDSSSKESEEYLGKEVMDARSANQNQGRS